MKFERKEIDRTFADSNKVTVVFIKKDGSERTMKCTRKPELMPEASRPKEDILQGGNINDDVYKVFDLEAMGWRCFSVAKLQSIVGEE